MLDLGRQLLDTAQMACQVLVDVQIGNLFDQPSSGSGGIQGVFA